MVTHSFLKGINSCAREDLLCGRIFQSSSTCGLSGPEEFSSLDALLQTNNQVCNFAVPELSHPAEALTDLENPQDPTTQTWWQSANGVEDVSLTLSLEGFFFLWGVRIDFKSPLPSAFVLEASQDFGGTFHPLRYFSTNCEEDFMLTDTPFKGDEVTREQLLCTSNFTNSYEDGGSNMVGCDVVKIAMQQ